MSPNNTILAFSVPTPKTLRRAVSQVRCRGRSYFNSTISEKLGEGNPAFLNCTENRVLRY